MAALMPKPRYTDKARYPNGYIRASETNVSETFRRIREQQAKDAAERKEKVEPIRKKA